MELSENEAKLYNFIKESEKENGVTVKDIERTLGLKAVGGLGRLLKEEKIEKKKLKISDDYNVKSVFHYKVRKESNE